MKRLGANLLYLVPGVVGGTEDYAVRVLRAVGENATGETPEIVLFARDAFRDAYPDLARRFTTVSVRLPPTRAARVLAESSWLPREARRHGVEVMHHFGGRVPARESGRCGVTVHDLQPLDRPQAFGVVKRRFLAYSLPRSAAKAALVVAVSRFVRDSIVRRLRVPPERVEVISAPCPPLDRDAALSPSRVDALPRVLAGALRSNTPYFVYPAITYEHKNHRTLIDAFAAVVPEHRSVLLVLTGGAGPADAAVAELVHDRGLDDRVVRTGRIPRDQLDTVIAGARALTFPSLYEGFGLPVVEALQLGCPPIVADATALPEATGGGGVRVPPRSVADWAAALTGALQWDEPARRALVAPARPFLDSLAPSAVAARWIGCHQTLG